MNQVPLQKLPAAFGRSKYNVLGHFLPGDCRYRIGNGLFCLSERIWRVFNQAALEHCSIL